jgi:hypothetical protein
MAKSNMVFLSVREAVLTELPGMLASLSAG